MTRLTISKDMQEETGCKLRNRERHRSYRKRSISKNKDKKEDL